MNINRNYCVFHLIFKYIFLKKKKEIRKIKMLYIFSSYNSNVELLTLNKNSRNCYLYTLYNYKIVI